MKSIRDWVFSQLRSKSVASSVPLSGSGSFFSEGPLDEDSNSRAHMVCSEVAPLLPDTSCSSDNAQENGSHPFLQEDSNRSNNVSDYEKMDALAKIEDLQVKFFRLLQWLGYSNDKLLVAKFLYRIHLATSIQGRELDLKRARKVATEQEAIDMPKLNFSVRILVLWKTAVGKSATINSIFDQGKAMTDAFEPATNRIREIVGNVYGVRVTFIDTTGFLPSSTNNIRQNRKIMLSVKRFIGKSPPDIVLFFERLDLLKMGYNDYEACDLSIW